MILNLNDEVNYSTIEFKLSSIRKYLLTYFLHKNKKLQTFSSFIDSDPNCEFLCGVVTQDKPVNPFFLALRF
jgi:hypothetical protein